MKQEIVLQKGDSYCSRVKTRMAELVLGEASIQENYSKRDRRWETPQRLALHYYNEMNLA